MSEENKDFVPKIVGIFCYWCTTQAAELAGTSRMVYPQNIRIVKTMCTSRVDPQLIMWAFKEGADGVLVSGCHPPGDCHYVDGNVKWYRKYSLLKKMIEQIGIDPKRLRQEWISASEADKLKQVVTEFTSYIKSIGPLNFQDGEK